MAIEDATVQAVQEQARRVALRREFDRCRPHD